MSKIHYSKSSDELIAAWFAYKGITTKPVSLVSFAAGYNAALAPVESKETPEGVAEGLFVVRLYDGFDMEWMDISEPVSKDEAERILNQHTKNGTVNTKFDDIDYYTIFPADTTMYFSQEGAYGERSRKGL